MRGTEVNVRSRVSVACQADAAGIQVQALPQVQRNITVNAEHTPNQQRQIVKTTCLDLIHTQCAMAVDQRICRCFGTVSQGNGFMLLAQDQFTHRQDPVGDVLLQVIRSFQGQRQTPASRTCTTGIGVEVAVQVQAIIGSEGNVASIAGHVDAALPRYVQ